MRWFRRLALLLEADAHGVLDQLEERSLLAKQHLREAELELDRKRARCEALADEARQIDEESGRLRHEIAALDADVTLALQRDAEELARFALRRLLPKRRALEGLEARGEQVAGERERLEAKLARQQRELDELSRQVRTRLARDGVASAEPAGRPAADEEVEIELLRRRAASAPDDRDGCSGGGAR